MLDSKQNSINNTVFGLSLNIIIGLAVGFMLVVIAWILDLNINDYSDNLLKNFAQMHLTNPAHFIIELFPFITAFTIHLFNKKKKEESILLHERIGQKDHRINKNADFAKQIGDGDFESDFQIDGNDDNLGKSLLLMRDNLVLNAKNEADQNWIAQGKDITSNILRMHNKIDDLSYEVVVNLIKYINAIQGALYIYDDETEILTNVATYAYSRKKYLNQEFKLGHGLIGQCAYEMDIIYRTEIPDDYVTISSGILGEQKPSSILIIPLISDEKLQGIIEFASLEKEIPELTITFLKELGEIIARTLYNLNINQKTEKLLQESQQMTEELQENEEQLRQNAEEMRATQEELTKSNDKLETQIKEVENVQKRLYSLLENASEIIAIYDKDFKMTYISPSVFQILGFQPDEMMNGKDMDRLSRKGEADFKELFKQVAEEPDKPFTIQYTYMKKDGKKIFLESIGKNMLSDPAINGIILNSQDITERKRAEKEERMKSKMQALSENSNDLIIRLNTMGQFFYANPVVNEYIGLTPVEIINKRLKELSFDDNLSNHFQEIIKTIKQDPVKMSSELTLSINIDKKESTRYMSFDAIPEFNENELETILIVGHDVTEAKRIEQEIKDKNKKIEDSINYAERIQTSILPDNSYIRKFLKKSFIYYKPRDVVSGDFPWFFSKEDDIYIAAVDCTGHGVPGALLSFIGYFILNNVVDHNLETASEVIDQLHYKVRSTLKQDQDEANSRDGMDIALCKISPKKKIVQYSGAHRPLYLLRKGELIEYKGDRKAIGGIPHRKKVEKDFTNYIIKYQEGDKIFFFSDGLPDQIGGSENKKYSPRRIRENISANSDLNMAEYHDFFSKDLDNWMGDSKQIDDILLIGIEF